MSRRFPTITASLGVFALCLGQTPALATMLQLDRAALAQGEFWRVATGHLTHWTASHLAWDLAAFALLGTLLERASRRLLVATLLASAVAISAAVWLFAPELATYRGLSGIDAALFAAVATRACLIAARDRRWLAATWPAIGALAFVAKVAVESTSATTLFVAPDAAFVPVPLAHGVGAAIGALVAGLAATCLTRSGPHRSAGAIPRRSEETAADRARPQAVGVPPAVQPRRVAG